MGANRQENLIHMLLSVHLWENQEFCYVLSISNRNHSIFGRADASAEGAIRLGNTILVRDTALQSWSMAVCYVRATADEFSIVSKRGRRVL